MILEKNQSLKEILHKLADDLRKVNTVNNTCEYIKVDDQSSCDCITDNYGTREQLIEKIKDLESRITYLVNLTNTLQMENKQIKNNVRDKGNKITTCLQVIERNNQDIGYMCSQVENIMKDRDKNALQVKVLTETVERNKEELLLKDQELFNIQSQLEAAKRERFH